VRDFGIATTLAGWVHRTTATGQQGKKKKKNWQFLYVKFSVTLFHGTKSVVRHSSCAVVG